MDNMILRDLCQNNLDHVSLTLPKKQIIVFTGVSGSGKSSIVFDSVAAQACRQMNETYPAFVRSRLPKYPRPDCGSMEGLSPCVVIDQSPLGSNARSTVGTASEIYSALRLLFSRIGQPYAGTASFFSFNDPAGMCPECAGLGQVTDIDMDKVLDRSKSLNEGAVRDTMMQTGSWYWKQFVRSGLFDPDKPICRYTEREYNLLVYGSESETGQPLDPKVPGIYHLYRKRYITRDVTNISGKKGGEFISRRLCPCCHGKRLNRIALSCWIDGCSIADLAELELTRLREKLLRIRDSSVEPLVEDIVRSLDRMIHIGLGYLSLSRPTDTLSGGEAQRLKLVRYLGSSLTDMLYIFDEPTAGMHPRDVHRMNELLLRLRDKGNTVLVVEHDPDMISIADMVVDVGPLAGKNGGKVVYCGSYDRLLEADTLTGKALRRVSGVKPRFRTPTGFLPVRNASLHNLKHCDADIPTGVICTLTGVAGSGKSSLTAVFAAQYPDRVVKIDQKPITATSRSTPASYLGIMDPIRRLFARENGVDAGWFSFHSQGGCPHCGGKGVIVTELAFMDPIVTTCEHCGGKRYNPQALTYSYKGKNILDVLAMTAAESAAFFTDKKILTVLHAMEEVGLGYMTLGQPLSTLSGGERQRIKLADHLHKKSRIYILDEPTTGLHPSDIDRLMALFDRLVDKGSSVILIEHNTEVMKNSDWLIDIGPDGGKNGGQVVFAGTPLEMIERSDTVTAKCLRKSCLGQRFTPEELAALTAAAQQEHEEEEPMAMTLVPVGRVESEPGQFRIRLDPHYAAALEGLEGFSHIQVLWWFDGCDNDRDRANLTEKKPYTGGPDSIGTFATRSPRRPNPIAVSVCQVTGFDREKGVLDVSYIDAVTGTPVLDIKPYTPGVDRVACPVVPDWCRHWPKDLESSGDFDWDREFNS